MNTLNTDKRGYLLNKDGSRIGVIKAPNKKGTVAPVKLNNVKVGEYILATGEVKDLKGNVLGMYKTDITSDEPSREDIDVSKLSKTELVKVLNDRREKEKEVYCQGKDSKLIVTGELGRMLYGDPKTRMSVSVADQELAKANKKHGWNYTDWETLSRSEDLDEKFLDEYDQYVDWYGFLEAHPKFTWSEKFGKRHWHSLMLRTLRIV